MITYYEYSVILVLNNRLLLLDFSTIKSIWNVFIELLSVFSTNRILKIMVRVLHEGVAYTKKYGNIIIASTDICITMMPTFPSNDLQRILFQLHTILFYSVAIWAQNQD